MVNETGSIETLQPPFFMSVPEGPDNNFTRGYFDINFVQILKGIRLGISEIFSEHCRKYLNFSGNYYICCLLEITRGREEMSQLQAPEVPYETMALIEKQISRSFPFYIIPLKSTLQVLVINLSRQKDQEILENLFRNISFGEQAPFITISLGRIREGLQNLWKSYSDAMTALNLKSERGVCQILNSAGIVISYKISYSFEDEKKIINCLKAKDIQTLTQILKRIICRNAEHNLSHKHMNILFSQLFNTGIRYAAEMDLDIKKVASEKEQEFFGTDNTEVCGYDLQFITLMTFFGRVMQKTQNEMQDHAQAMVEHIIRYVQNNYYSGIYLDKIASYMALSTKYISRIFKERMGISLIDYISRLQIEKAKYLLLNTNLCIDEIGRQVGINNRVTFYRLFKKHEGISPGSFRSSTGKPL